MKKAAALKSADLMKIEVTSALIPAVGKATDERGAWNAALDSASKQVDDAAKLGVRILSPRDCDYPSLLAATRDDPALLYVKGSLSGRAGRAVAIIGTREPTEHGAIVAERMATFFSEAGWTVVSGLAIGCDAIAHQAAVDAAGHTIAVLAHGLHMVAPARHRKLAQDILDAGGALVSEFPVGQNAMPQQFVKRDRTQAGLAEGVVMIQSDLKGGSLHASRASIDYGRWLAVPYPTQRDIRNAEPKIQANLMLSDGSASQKIELLRCRGADTTRIISVRGREDYPNFLSFGPNDLGREPRQSSLL
ncbi:DNA-processing protein DprA [Sphingomonas sp. BK580]|uniref:DNA-processing protein DprA n=1 Tax=Sphingomonas sp. BK580 TaxID=2586972 RepID=UPI0017FEEE71|nr:DNA-processing protein DprA [Sphingomonas sp. BK580]MBB3695825.1 DNA processing protein [Sphingomonas sp. BK580]